MNAPLVVLPPDEDLDAAMDAVARAGARVIPGWSLPTEPWDVAAERVVCCGSVRSPSDARDALVAAVRGAGLVVVIDDESDLGSAFLEDLERVGPVQRRARAATLPLAAEPRRLLELVASGRSIPEAAAALFISVRTAERRMGEARRALGVRTTAEAVQVFVSSGAAR